MAILNPNDPNNRMIINPVTGQTPSPQDVANSVALSRSALVDPVSRTRPVIRIKDPDAFGGTRLINVEDFRPETMTAVSDAFRVGDQAPTLTAPATAPAPSQPSSPEEEVIEEEEEEEISECPDLEEFSKSELIALAEEHEISVDKKSRAEDLRKIIKAGWK